MVLAWEDVNLPEVHCSPKTCLMLPKGKVSTVYCKFLFFFKLWVHFPLKIRLIISGRIPLLKRPLCLIGVTNAKNM